MRRMMALFGLLVLLVLAATASAQVGTNPSVRNANLAEVAELKSVPHVDAALAAKIIAGRPYLSVAALQKVLGAALEAEQLKEVYVKLFVPLDLNRASRDEILLIPGVGRRMAHEFEEYRPYKSLAQFRREIGKYVDDEQVARYEQYVFVPIRLNSASDEDILSIPGVGKRMLHEFKEYRPYKSMAQFEREIGKYVDDAELARLARFVVVD